MDAFLFCFLFLSKKEKFFDKYLKNKKKKNSIYISKLKNKQNFVDLSIRRFLVDYDRSDRCGH